MFANLDRDQFIELLQELGDDDDEAVLTAARDLHARITVAGISWDDLLVPEREPEADLDNDDEEPVAFVDMDGDESDGNEDALLSESEKAEALTLIDKLLEKGVSADTKEELEDYKTDIADGEFFSNDLRYLKALYKRLTS